LRVVMRARASLSVCVGGALVSTGIAIAGIAVDIVRG